MPRKMNLAFSSWSMELKMPSRRHICQIINKHHGGASNFIVFYTTVCVEPSRCGFWSLKSGKASVIPKTSKYVTRKIKFAPKVLVIFWVPQWPRQWFHQNHNVELPWLWLLPRGPFCTTPEFWLIFSILYLTAPSLPASITTIRYKRKC